MMMDRRILTAAAHVRAQGKVQATLPLSNSSLSLELLQKMKSYCPQRLLCVLVKMSRLVSGRKLGMNINQLRFAVAVAQTSSFTQAAEQCNVTQPTLSNSVAQL